MTVLYHSPGRNFNSFFLSDFGQTLTFSAVSGMIKVKLGREAVLAWKR